MKLNQFKNIIFDRDGIINEVVIRNEIISSPRSINEFLFRDDFINFVEYLDNSFRCFIFTNQPDVSRNLLKEKDLKMMHDLINKRYKFDEIVYCPSDDDNCDFRKPNPGMLNYIISKFNLKRSECLVIGDSIKDIKAANNANLACVYLNTSYNDDISTIHNISSLEELL